MGWFDDVPFMDYVSGYTVKMSRDFAKAILEGLSKDPKEISSTYLYNEEGTRLFDVLTHAEDYYLTSCDKEILKTHARELGNIFSKMPFRVIELGAGNAEKISLLIQEWLDANLSFHYVPIDISSKAIGNIERTLHHIHPSLRIESFIGDYFSALKKLNSSDNMRNILLFLGSNIGNFTPKGVEDFLRKIRLFLTPQDFFLIGFDLKKDPDIIRKAYNDSQKVTKSFNLNLLTRINKELEGSFDLSGFDHQGIYDETKGVNESFIVSLKNQDVFISALNKNFTFQKGEKIKTGHSYKFSLEDIKRLAKETGYQIVQTFPDSKNYFVESLWKVL